MKSLCPITCISLYFEYGLIRVDNKITGFWDWILRKEMTIFWTCVPINWRRGTQEDNKTTHWRRTDQWLVSLPPAGPGCPIACQSAKPVAILSTVRPSRCAHGSGRGDHATPSRPRQSACAGGTACVTAVTASGTDGNQLRQHRALLKRRGGGACSGACSGLSARHWQRSSWRYSVCEQQCLQAYVFCRSCSHFLEEWEAYVRLLKWDCFCTLLALSPPPSPRQTG